MSASWKLCVFIALTLAVPLLAEQNGGIEMPKNKSNFKRLLRFFGIGAPVTGNQIPQYYNPNQFNPCALPPTTTTTPIPFPLGPLCPFPQPNIGQPVSIDEQGDRPFPPLRPPPPFVPDLQPYQPFPIPVPVDPLRPVNPVLVNPTGPLRPFEPTVVDPLKPTAPSQPVMVDPVIKNQDEPLTVTPVTPSVSQPDNVGQGTSPGISVGPTPILPVFGPPPTILKPLQPEGPHPPTQDNSNLRPLPCSALRQFVPSGFSPASASFYSAQNCPSLNPLLRNEPPCSTLDALNRLGATIMRSLIINSELDLFLSQTSQYTVFAPLDVAFKRLPIWFIKNLQSDPKLRKAFVLNHIVKEDVPLAKMGNEYLVQTARPGATRVRINTYFPESELRIYTVDGARILRGDILTSKGRIHLTDKVIMPNPPRNAAEYLSEKIEFERFWNVVKNSNLEIFQSDRPITVFIPINEAVDKLDTKTMLKDEHQIKNFINYHLLNGTHYGSGIINNEFLMTNFEKEIKLGVASDGFAKHLTKINGYVNILKSDIPLINGVAHIIDRCISEKLPFYVHDESDEFGAEYGVISRRNMKVTGEEKELKY